MPTDLRSEYENAVSALRQAADARLASGCSEEDVAHWVVAERNLIKETYRRLTPAPLLARIVARTETLYGRPDGPTVEDLRASGRSWTGIIDSATRAGSHRSALFEDQ
jgi:filamentous hemagglutinin